MRTLSGAILFLAAAVLFAAVIIAHALCRAAGFVDGGQMEVMGLLFTALLAFFGLAFVASGRAEHLGPPQD